MNADGKNQTRLTNNTILDFSPSWSPDGTKIVFSTWRDSNNEIYVMNADGKNQTRLTVSKSNTGDYFPIWSPDGKKIAFTSTRDSNYEIYVMNADGTNQTRLTDSVAFDSLGDWSAEEIPG